MLADVGVDFILLEYVSSISEAVQAVEAASKTNLPVFLAICEVTVEGKMRFGEPVEQLIEALEGYQVAAILPHCCLPESISATLPKLRKVFDGPVGGYPEAGYGRAPQPANYPESQWHVIDIGESTPERLAEVAREWLDMGAQIIGGCCATTPEHIAALRPVVRG